MNSRFIIALLTLLLFPCWVHAADDKRATEKQLSALKSEIKGVEQRLKKDRQRQSRAAKELAETEQKISGIGKRIHELDQQLGGLNTDLESYQKKRQALEESLEKGRASIEQLIRQQYRLGHQPRLFMLLNQRDPEQLSRMMRYYDRFTQAQADEITEYQALLRDLQSTHQAIDSTQQSIVANRESLKAELAEQQALKAERAQQVSALQKSVKQGQSKLSQLQQDQRRLAKLLADIEKSLSLANLTQNNQAFKTLRGKLSWPLSGKIVRSFGSSYDNLTYDGLLISGSAGQSVKAVHHGRVVFSEWLRGYGLLVILDHGDGYMSLYGHNDALLKTTGDWVSQGEAISTVGQSGGYSEPGLYFAIRYKGKAINPRSWLASK
ncbi:murein hydrolase activator EnvC [Neptunomonas sp.]|uniref:murein hydrolase activator EnvC family protein n=1 Tax=Neptunomonas TaxID=75687 RepID=UPI00351321B7